MKFLKWFFGLFSKYVNSFERRVDRFFRNIKSTDSIGDIREKLLTLMQENLLVLNVWMERKYKGYTYLNKKTRRELYKNAEKNVRIFKEFCAKFSPDEKEIKVLLENVGLTFLPADNEKLKYIFQIMNFLRPELHYHYVESASFGKLLRDVEFEKMVGDCNQIVTLYIYFYSLKFPVSDLKIKLLPEHVCLRFNSIDIEATNATFQNYKDNTQILPVTEIISTNLLDITESEEELYAISSRDVVKSAQLAYAISSLKSLVEKNLKVAYHNVAVHAMNANDFETAVFYAEKDGDSKLLAIVYHNAAVYYMKQNNFKKAQYCADRTNDSELKKAVKQADLMRKYNELVKKVQGVKTLDQAKKYKSTYVQMLSLAREIGDSDLERSVSETLSKI